MFVVTRRSRLKPGGSAFTTNVVFATDRRIIIKDPSMLGMCENVVDFDGANQISNLEVRQIIDAFG